MDTYDRIIQYLDANHAIYECFTHPPVASAREYHDTLHTRYSQQAKALFVRYTDATHNKGYYVIALPGDKQADFDSIKKALQLQDLRMAYENELTKYTGCVFGQLPPLGKLFGFRLLMDTSFLRESIVYFNVGRHDTSIKMAPAQILRLEDPLLMEW